MNSPHDCHTRPYGRLMLTGMVSIGLKIVKRNVDETIQLREPFSMGDYLNFKPGLRIEIIDPHTLRFHFAEPDGAALHRLSYIHIANRQFLRDFGWGGKQW